MKSILRWGVTLLTVGGAILGTWVIPGLRALALSQAEVEEQLRGIPVFTITDPEGNPFVAVVPNQAEDGAAAEGNTIITEVFISADDAERSLQAFQEANPDLGNNAQVTPVSLALIYKAAIEAQSSTDTLQFYFVPIVEEVAYAVSLLPEDEQVSPGVPLFIVSSIDEAAAAGAETENNTDRSVTLLTIQNGEDEIIPLFFTQDQFQSAIAAIDDSNPAFRENLQVDVIWLGDYIRRLELAEGSDIQQYRMIPLDESLDFVESFKPLPASESSTPSGPDDTNSEAPAPTETPAP